MKISKRPVSNVTPPPVPSAVVAVPQYDEAQPSKRVFDPAKHCGAQLRKKTRGRLCTHYKGANTPHVGAGRCWLHGGLTPIKHGLCSLIKHDRLKDLIKQMEAAGVDLMDLTPEITIMRALVLDYVNRHDDFIDMLTTWYDAMDTQRAGDDLPPLPRKFPTIEDAATLLEAISRIIERMHKMQREGSITLDVFRSLMGQMGMVVANHIADEKTLGKIEDGWASILVNPRSFVRDSGTKADPIEGED